MLKGTLVGTLYRSLRQSLVGQPKTPEETTVMIAVLTTAVIILS